MERSAENRLRGVLNTCLSLRTWKGVRRKKGQKNTPFRLFRAATAGGNFCTAARAGYGRDGNCALVRLSTTGFSDQHRTKRTRRELSRGGKRCRGGGLSSINYKKNWPPVGQTSGNFARKKPQPEADSEPRVSSSRTSVARGGKRFLTEKGYLYSKKATARGGFGTARLLFSDVGSQGRLTISDRKRRETARGTKCGKSPSRST